MAEVTSPIRDRWSRSVGWAVAAVAALTVIAFALRVRGFGEGLWHDELYTLAETRGKLRLGDIKGVENTPPLYFVLAWLSGKLGDPTTWIRLPSIVFGTATVPLVFLLGRRTVGTLAAVVGAGFVAISPFAVFYGIEARAYATLMFFAALSALTLLVALERPSTGRWAAYAVAVSGVLYTHYTGLVVIAVEGGWALWFCRERWHGLLLAYAGAALAFAAWLPNVHGAGVSGLKKLAELSGVGHDEAFLMWVAGSPELPLDEMPGVVPLVLLGCAVALGLLGGLAALARHRAQASGGARPPASRRLLVLLLAVATPIALLLYSLVGSDLFVFPRNLSASLPFVGLVLGWALTPPNRLVTAAAVALAAVALGIGAGRTLEERYHRPNFPDVVQLLDDRAGPRDLIVYFGAGFRPFTLAGALPDYYSERHVTRGSDERTDSAVGTFRLARSRRVFLVGFGGDRSEPTPAVPGWEKVEQRFYVGNPGLVVAVYERLTGGYELAKGMIRRPDGPPLRIEPRQLGGVADGGAVTELAVTLSGWAADGHRPVDQVLAFVGPRLAAATIPTLKRTDLEHVWRVAPYDLGFSLALPRRREPGGKLALYGVSGGVAGPLELAC